MIAGVDDKQLAIRRGKQTARVLELTRAFSEGSGTNREHMLAVRYAQHLNPMAVVGDKEQLSIGRQTNAKRSLEFAVRRAL